MGDSAGMLQKKGELTHIHSVQGGLQDNKTQCKKQKNWQLGRWRVCEDDIPPIYPGSSSPNRVTFPPFSWHVQVLFLFRYSN